MLSAQAVLADTGSDSQDQVEHLTLIHIGDIHGHLVPRPNLRSDAQGNRPEGGLARMYTVIQKIRNHADDGDDDSDGDGDGDDHGQDSKKRTLLLNTGDTIQGSAEALYTRGQALVDVLNDFGIDGFAPGNWEFVYGTARFKELFAGAAPLAPWGTVSANVRNVEAGKTCPQSSYVLPPYLIKEMDGIRVGLLGFTTDRGPQVVGSAVTAGLCFLNATPGSSGTPDVSEVEAELRSQIAHLRNVEKVDLVVLLSELGLANNSQLATRNNGIDVVLSADMHEETPEAVVVTTPGGGKTIIVEEGQDGTNLGELRLTLKNKKLHKWKWKSHVIDATIRADEKIAEKIAQIRAPFVSGPAFQQQVNPFNNAVMRMPIDTVLGETAVGLHRSNFAGEPMPAVIEGTSHNFLTDAFRAVAEADIGAIRGFRYGTHVAPGPVKLEDIYHFMPIGPRIAKGTIPGQAVKNQIENAADGSLNPEPRNWTGGWLFGFSGVTMDFDPYNTNPLPGALPLNRATNIKVGGAPLKIKNPDGTNATYTYASYWYNTDPTLVNRVGATNIRVAVRDPATGKAKFVPVAEIGGYEQMDGTEIVAQYLQDNLGGKVQNLDINRINLLAPLPAPVYGNPEAQPLRGAQ
ncbi:MAG: 5'-nucleotidase C-terminal domain-containing protein [Thiobacillus sp.]|nr:5'-nucleotidase C-terminal domain-containing protein [Thiobacillus sp.]